jgi:glycosyltransferase involved in cell wall biosynthesis
VDAHGEPTGGSGYRARVDGKFLEVGGRRFLIKGVAYGTFAPGQDGAQFPRPDRIDQDFAAMAAAGINTVRTYTPPSRGLLDTAQRHGLKVMAGLAWPQHVPFLDDRKLVRRIRREVAETVGHLADHPASLLFALGNEIPPGMVRWHGHRRVERFLRELYEEAKSAAPESLLTYVSFPPTEYLDLDVFDVAAYNVYLHRESELRGYLARLQHVAGARPLLLAEAGGDSMSEGRDGQARITASHLQAAFAEGACGAVAYSWTDEWWRGGCSVEDWAFGLVDEERRPKPALAAVRDAFAQAPFPDVPRAEWPKVSVVVCAYNAEDTIGDCLDSLDRLKYPDFEVVVVDDGSRDATGEIAKRRDGVRVIEVPNGGLSAARNVGLAAATGEVVAYTDADAEVDPDWLGYLVQPLLMSDVVGVGGPNVVPQDDPWVAQCVARSPGGPIHVMLDDRIAEHVPGCNMAFWRDALLDVDGFNPVYLRAGDDVDICWRLQARKQRIGFAPSALVWHHHRSSVRAYWRQQVGYGEAETWLDAHHPEKFLGGHMVWRGRIYSPLPFLQTGADRRVNTGVWGTAAFPSVYSTRARGWQYLPHSPAWMVVSLVLFLIGVFGPLAGMDAAWLPLIAGFVGGAATLGRCLWCGWHSDVEGLSPIGRWSRRQSRFLYRALISWLHLIQPLARFRGRLRGLSRPRPVEPQHMSRHPWRAPMPTIREVIRSFGLIRPSGTERAFWAESWISPTKLLTELVGMLRAARPAQTVDVDEGWHPDRDLSLSVGRWGWLHVQTVMEEHEAGACLFRLRARLRPSGVGTVRGAAVAVLVAGGMSASMFLYEPGVTLLVSAIAVAGIAARAAWQAIRGAGVLEHAVSRVTAAAGLVRIPFAGQAVADEQQAPEPSSAREPVPGRDAAVPAPEAPGEPRPPVLPVLPAARRTEPEPSDTDGRPRRARPPMAPAARAQRARVPE